MTKTARVYPHKLIFCYEMIDDLSCVGWNLLLDELRSEYLPGIYPPGWRTEPARCNVDGEIELTVYLTPRTVTGEEAMAILQKWGFCAVDCSYKQSLPHQAFPCA